jgi:EEF1A N-terminal glycine/lysine methyltransferase
VVVTDYPDTDLIANLQHNVDNCDLIQGRKNIRVVGYLWGNPVGPLLDHIDQGSTPGFDVLVLADILFNHSEHTKLIKTLEDALKRGGDAVALVFFTPYRPWLLEKDLHFFELARARGFETKKIHHQIMDKVMFDKDPGDELLRRTVFGYEVRRKV